MKTLAIISNKGGGGKTTTAVHLGRGLSRAGHSVLLCDLDPKHTLTSALISTPEKTMFNVILGDDIANCILSVSRDSSSGGHLDIVPGGVELAGAHKALGDPVPNVYFLSDAIKSIRPKNRYGWIILDTVGESADLLSFAAVCAADFLIIVIGSDYFSFLSLKDLDDMLARSRTFTRRRPNVLGILPNMIANNHSLLVLDVLRKNYGDRYRIFNGVPRTAKIPDALFKRQVFLRPSHPAGAAYLDLVRFLEENS